MWFIGVEVEQETRAPPPKINPGFAPAPRTASDIDAIRNEVYYFLCILYSKSQDSGFHKQNVPGFKFPRATQAS